MCLNATAAMQAHASAALKRAASVRFGPMTEASQNRVEPGHGTALPPADLSAAQLEAAPLLTSVDALLVDGLSDDEDDAFAAALGA